MARGFGTVSSGGLYFFWTLLMKAAKASRPIGISLISSLDLTVSRTRLQLKVLCKNLRCCGELAQRLVRVDHPAKTLDGVDDLLTINQLLKGCRHRVIKGKIGEVVRFTSCVSGELSAGGNLGVFTRNSYESG